ncbi:MAG: ATP-binding protein [Deltaproteobacteria bacterium]|nr:ATP-binding protein [Deltaproteobacteria bacterium]
MYSRNIALTDTRSFFLFGPRSTGKSTWLRNALPKALFIDLLDSEIFTTLLAQPQRLEGIIPVGWRECVVIDEVQKVPALLDEVHRLIESKHLRFVLTGSSSRKLRHGGYNLLAGRAHLREMYPLTAAELGADFSLAHSLVYGQLPLVYVDPNPTAFLKSYVSTYLNEEIQQEGLTRRLATFARFLETASFSQGAVLNISSVARDAAAERKLIESYFAILEDLLIGIRLQPFVRKAKRRLVLHPKFYFFDVGLFRALRPRGPLDSEAEILGPAAETLVLQELRAHNSNAQLGYDLYYWRSTTGAEVDFVLYGERGLVAIEVKAGAHLRAEDHRGLAAFRDDYPMAKCYLLYTGTRAAHESGVEIIPLAKFLPQLGEILAGE